MKKIFKNIFLGLALTACTATPLAVGLSFLGKNAGDASVKNDGSYVLVDELWNNDGRVFLRENVNTLLKYLGLEGKTVYEINNTSTKNASDFRAVEIKGEKNSGQDVNVMLGGLEWTVCYLSHDENNDCTYLTLWLSNSTQDAFTGRSQTEGEYYGYITDSLGTGLYSDWSYNWEANNPSDSYPSSMYGTSYVRAVTLNNGGKYALSGNTLSAKVEKNSNSAFALFTMSANNDGNDLVNYIATPSSMSWQESGQNFKNVGYQYKTSNENWGTETDDDFYSDSNGVRNFSSKSGYDTWKNDKLWLPSMSETGYNTTYTGLWQTSIGQRKNYNGLTESIGSTMGTNKGSVYSWSSLRSAMYTFANGICALYPSGASHIFENVTYSYAVRPALHLDLSSVINRATYGVNVSFDANGGECSTDSIRYYNSKRVNLPTPTKAGYKFNGWYGKFDGTESSVWLLGTDYDYTGGELNVHLSAYSDDWSRLEGDNYERLISYALSGGMGWRIESDINDTKQYITFTAYDDEIYDYRRAVSNIKFSDLSVGWHDFDMTLYGGVLSGYVDGKKIASVGFAGSVKYYGGRGLVVGGEYDNAADWNIDHCFTGYIGNVAIGNECFYPNLIMPKGSYYNSFLLPYVDDDVTLYAKWGDLVEYKTYYDYFIDNMDCTGVYDTDGNLTNVTISAEKKAEILANDFTGSGTSTDPYQINTSLGFWFMSKFVNITLKYVEINCDIILNDEQFDENGDVIVNENGEPVYGDGIVYSWLDRGYNFGNDFCLDGHKHTIHGMYLNTESTFDFSLFGYGTVKELKNFNMANSFVKMNSGHVGMMVCGVQKISNCHNLSGRIEFTSTGYLAGITYTISEKMENCSNYAEIYAPNCSICGGIYVFNTKNDIYLDNVINYGNITAKWCGGFIPGNDRDVNIVMNNCKNYGKITALGNHCGAFFALFNGYNICVNMINCANYGDVEASGNGAGICGYCIGDWNIVNFKNYGKITAAYAGSFFGIFVNSGRINIKDCYSTSQNNAYIFDCIYNKDVVEIDGLEIEFDSDEKTAICRAVSVGAEVNLQNVLIKGKCKNYTGCIINRVSSAKNVLVDIECTSISTRTNYLCGNTDFSANGVMLNIHTSSKSIKHYYGTSFRDFYLDWKTNKIGLSSIDGVGTFQGKITEEWLTNNGFEKKN